MYDQPPAMKQRRPPMTPPGGSPGPMPPPGTGGIRMPPTIPGGTPGPTSPPRIPPSIPGGTPGPTGVGGYPANDLPPAAMGVGVHLNPMPPRMGGGGPAYGGPPIQAMPPRITRPPTLDGGPTPPGPPQFGGGPGLAPGLPGGPGGNPYMQPPQAAGTKPHYDTSMPDEWRRQRQRQALGQEQ